MKNRVKDSLSITVQGTVIGKIWMPATYCADVFTLSVDQERNRFVDKSLSIFEAIDRKLSQWGDFQSLSLVECTLTLSFRRWHIPPTGSQKTTYTTLVEKTYDLKESKVLKGLFANAKEIKEYDRITDSIFQNEY